MNDHQILALGLGLQAPWELTEQRLDTAVSPHELHLTVSTDRGTRFPCPECGQACPAHDYKELVWRHLNFFQHHCYLHARVPRVKCPKHGVKRINVPWARPGSDFTLLFEQAAMLLVREMPVLAAARFMEITDTRLWRIVYHYVAQSIKRLDLSDLTQLALDETASRRGHRYVTVFLDMARTEKPVIFAIPGRGKEALGAFSQFLQAHDGTPEQVTEVVCDMSPAFLSGIDKEFPQAEVTVDWFHIVQVFTRSVDDVRKVERREKPMPKALRWAVLKNFSTDKLTDKQIHALHGLLQQDLETSKAWLIKEKLRWIRQAPTPHGARWRITNFLNFARDLIGDRAVLQPVRDALKTLEKHADRVIRRWSSTLTNARLEGMNSLFQAARSRARGYRNTENFIAMIYLIGSPIEVLPGSIKST